MFLLAVLHVFFFASGLWSKLTKFLLLCFCCRFTTWILIKHNYDFTDGSIIFYHMDFGQAMLNALSLLRRIRTKNEN